MKQFEDFQRNYLRGYIEALVGGNRDVTRHVANIESFLLHREINPSAELLEAVRASLD